MANKRFTVKLKSERTPYQHTSKYTRKFIVAGIIFTWALVSVPIGTLIFLPMRIFVYLCAKVFRPDLKNFLTSLDSIFTLADPLTTAKVNICFFFICDGHIDLSDFRLLFQKRVIEKLKPNGKLMYPQLKQFWTSFLSYTMFKEDINFDLHNHVRLFDYNADLVKKYSNSNLDQIQEEFCSEKILQSVLGPLLERSWPAKRSPWEVLLVQNYKRECDVSLESNAKPSTAIIFRIHHALADGYSVQKMMVRDLMLTPPDFKINFPKWNMWETILFYAILPFKLPWDFTEFLFNTIDGPHCWSALGRKNKLSRNVLTSISKPIDIQLIKDVRNKYSVGYNAVLCSASANACRRMMIEANQVVPKEIKCMIPIPLRNHPDGLVYHVTADYFPWEMNTELTNEDRLDLISERMSPSKYYMGPLGCHLSVAAASIYPAPLVKLSFANLSLNTAVFTSLPFPQEIIFRGLDVRIVDIFWGCGPGMGLGGGVVISLVSSNGKQRITGIVDKSIFPWEEIFEKFGQYVEEELKKLAELEKKLESVIV